jgi:hypothetical protein
MTLPVYPNTIAVTDVVNEFGLPGDSFSNFYSGNGYVPTGCVGFPQGAATAIPTSGSISLDNMHGATGPASGSLLSNWWANRDSLFRSNISASLAVNGNYAGGGSYCSGSYNYNAYPGADSYTLHGGQGPSTGSHQTYTPTFTFGSTSMYATVWTILVVAKQAYDDGSPQYMPTFTTNPYCPGYSGTYIGTVRANGFLCGVYQVNTGVTNTPPAATATYTWLNYSEPDNTGSSIFGMAIPGAWHVSSQTIDTNTAASSTYSYNIGPNQFSIFAGSDKASSNTAVGPYAFTMTNGPLTNQTTGGALITSQPSGLNTLQYEQYWWSSSATTFNFNTTASTLTQGVAGSIYADVETAPANGKTPATYAYEYIPAGLNYDGLGVLLIFSQS